MDDKRKEAERIVTEMERDNLLSRTEDLIKDNRIEFVHDKIKYQVRLLNLAEKEELDMLRRKKFGHLIQDKDILLEKDLIKQYKERGIDIEEIDEHIKKLNSEEENLTVKLGESISKNEEESVLKTAREQIEELRMKKNILYTQKNLLLEYSLENQLLTHVAQLITYLSLYMFEDNEWHKMFNSLEDFQNYKDESLINKAASYSMSLQYL
jgi:DNA-binding transcriptional MerR regulator